MSAIRYARAPSPAFRALLHGPLAPLLRPRVVAGLPLDLHLREGDHLHAYCGLTRLFDLSPAGDGVKIDAHSTYRSQPCGLPLFRRWAPGEPGLVRAMDAYLRQVQVDPRHLRREGAVQAYWSLLRRPWIPFDREAVLGYPNTGAQTAGRAFPEIATARAEIEALPRDRRWAPLPKDKVGAELDQLAVDPDGTLVLLELKDASASPASVFYAPLQLLQYVHEWASALEAVQDQLAALIEARVALGMTPPLPPLNGRLRPVIAFGQDSRSAEVRARFDAVRAVVDRHLPTIASPLESWALSGGSAVRLGRR